MPIVKTCPDCGKTHWDRTTKCSSCYSKSNPRKIKAHYFCSHCKIPFNPPRKRNLCSACDYQHRGKIRKIKYKTGQRKEKQAALDEFYKDGCKLCGNTQRVVLQAHHKIPHEKNFAIGNAFHNATTVAFIEELNKCVPLCANCHLLVHAGIAVID